MGFLYMNSCNNSEIYHTAQFRRWIFTIKNLFIHIIEIYIYVANTVLTYLVLTQYSVLRYRNTMEGKLKVAKSLSPFYIQLQTFVIAVSDGLDCYIDHVFTSGFSPCV